MRTTREIEADNARTIHALLSPFSTLMQIVYALGLLGMVVCWLFIRQTGWIVDLGPRSERARQAIVENTSLRIGSERDDPGHIPMIDITVDFTDRAGGTNTNEISFPIDAKEPWHWPDHFWVSERQDYVADGGYIAADGGQDPKEPYTTFTPFVLTTDRADFPLLGLPYCHTGHPGLFDTKLPPWGDREDPNNLLNRKSGRMRRDYETAAIMVSALRSALAHLKAGQALTSEYGPATGEPLQNSYCNADGADPGVLSPAQIAAYRAATFEVHLVDAPRVKFRYVYLGQAMGSNAADFAQDERWREAGMQIIGMCPVGECDNDAGLTLYTTYSSDLWGKDPPLSPIQMEAERELLQTATWDFWLKQARANGVTETAPLKAEYASAQGDLKKLFN